MFDLHVHTRHSDGALDTLDVLKLAEDAGIKIISITDHNTVDAYKDLEKINIKNYFSGKIIAGIEIDCNFGDCGIEVLGYGFNLEKLRKNEVMNKYFPVSIKAFNRLQLEKYKEICRAMGIKFSEDLGLQKEIWANNALIEDIIKYPENKQILEDLGIAGDGKHRKDFLEKHALNKDSQFYCNYHIEGFPTIFEVADAIKSSGGKSFLAHPFRYKMEGRELVDKIAKLNILDGFECINKIHSFDETEWLIQYCDDNKLLKSAGSDFHRPIEHKMGYGSQGSYPIKYELVADLIAGISPLVTEKSPVYQVF